MNRKEKISTLEAIMKGDLTGAIRPQYYPFIKRGDRYICERSDGVLDFSKEELEAFRSKPWNKCITFIYVDVITNEEVSIED